MEDRMDWSKTKTFLIIALIFTNVILGYFYFSQKLDGGETVSDMERLNQVVKLLEHNNISVKADTEIEVPNVIGMKVEFEQYDLDDLDLIFFQTDNLTGTSDIYHEYGDYYSQIKQDTILEYRKKNMENLDWNRSTGDEAKVYADQFLIRTKYYTDETLYIDNDRHSQYYKFDYVQVINNRLMLDSKMSVKVNNNEVIGFERYWIKNYEDIVAEDRFIDLGNALYVLLEKIYLDFPDREDRIIVEEIGIGYEVSKNNPMVEYSGIVSGTADPYWIIETNVKTYHIEALKK